MHAPSLRELEELRMLQELDDLDRLSFAMQHKLAGHAEAGNLSARQLHDCRYEVHALAKMLLKAELWRVHNIESRAMEMVEMLVMRCRIRYLIFRRWLGGGGWDNDDDLPMPDRPVMPYNHIIPAPVTSA